MGYTNTMRSIYWLLDTICPLAVHVHMMMMLDIHENCQSYKAKTNQRTSICVQRFCLFSFVFPRWPFGSVFKAVLVTSTLSSYSRLSCCETAVSQLPTVEAYDITQCSVWGEKGVASGKLQSAVCCLNTHIPSYHSQKCVKTRKLRKCKVLT